MKEPDLSECPKFLRKWLEPIVKYSTSRTPRQGIGFYTTDAVDDTGIIGTTVPPTPGTTAAATQSPFQIITQLLPGSTTQYQFGVVNNLILYSGANVTSPPTIPTQAIATGASGLLTSATPTTTDAGWVTWNASNDYVWLEGAFSTWPSLSTVQIQSLSNSGSYGGGDVENDGGSGTPTVYTQTKFRVLIGTLTAPVSPATAPIVKQLVNANMVLQYTSKDSFDSSGGSENKIAALYPFPCLQSISQI